MTAFQIYVLLKLDSAIGLFTVFAIAVPLIVGFSWLGYVMLADIMEDGAAKNFKKVLRQWTPFGVIMTIVFTLAAVLTPTTQQLATMVVVPKIINAVASDKELMALPGDIVSLASAWVKELRPENIKEGAKTIVQPAKEGKPVEK